MVPWPLLALVPRFRHQLVLVPQLLTGCGSEAVPGRLWAAGCPVSVTQEPVVRARAACRRLGGSGKWRRPETRDPHLFSGQKRSPGVLSSAETFN